MWVNNVPSSTIDDDPDALPFEYMQHVAALIRAWGPPREMLALHVGAAACTLPRHLIHAYPQSRHIAVEVDAELARLAREWADLPRAPRLRIRVGDGLEVLRARHPESVDLIVRDAFTTARVPEHLAGDDFWAECARVVRPGGLVIANTAMRPGEDGARTDAAAAARYLGPVTAVGDPGCLKGSRFGNVVFAAGDVDQAALSRFAGSAPVPTVVRPAWAR